MRFVLLISLLFTAHFANARSLEGFQGKIHNYTKFPLESFKIEISWFQWRRDLLGFKKNLQSGSIPFQVSPTGQFTIPKVNLGYGHHHSLRVSFTAQNTPAEGYPRAFRSIDLDDKEINKLPEILNQISIYYTEAQAVPLKLESAKDVKLWLADEALETFLVTEVNFKNALLNESVYQEERTYPAFFNGNIPPRVFFIFGNLGANPQVTTNLEVRNYALSNKELAISTRTSELGTQIPFAEVLVKDQELPKLDRSISGSYPVLLYVDTKVKYERDMFDGTLTLLCDSQGTLTGKLQGTPRGGNRNQISLDAEIFGSCDEQTATLGFNLELPSLAEVQRLDGLVLGIAYRGAKKHLRGEHTTITGRDTPFSDVKLESQDLNGRLEVK